MTDTPFLSVDPALCAKCGLCESVCPNDVFVLHFDSTPSVETVFSGRCIRCGHCKAVCRTDAFNHCEIRREFCDVDDAVTFSPDALQQLFETRRSCRSFTSQRVGDDALTALLEAAGTAPTATNAQNVRFVCLDHAEHIGDFESAISGYYLNMVSRLSNPFWKILYRLSVGKRIADAYQYHLPVIEARFKAVSAGEKTLFYNAPLVLVGFASGLSHMAAANVNLAVMQMMLKAETLGLGTLFNGYALTALQRDGNIRKQVGILKGYTPAAVLAIGYPSVRYLKVPPRRMPRVIRPFETQDP